MREKPTHVLVTGGAGFLGTGLTEALLRNGSRVTVLDRLFFGDTLGDLRADRRLRVIQGDIRTCPESVFKGVDAVVDLAALSNDPAGDLDPKKTMDINFRGRARVGRFAKKHGVKRYVVSSSCSIYGFQDGIVDETSRINPLTTYAEANGKVEAATLKLGDRRFTATALRLSTAFGWSRRMRFDLAINGMTLSLFRTGKARIMRDGMQWRPFVDVRDVARAFVTTLEAAPDAINGEIFNIGAQDLNVQIQPLARRLSAAVGIPFVEDWYGDPDHRSYRVAFSKAMKTLKYEARIRPEEAAKEIFAKLQDGSLKDEPSTRTVEWYKSLLEWNERLREVALDGRIL